jgi:hypothetical protein
MGGLAHRGVTRSFQRYLVATRVGNDRQRHGQHFAANRGAFGQPLPCDEHSARLTRRHGRRRHHSAREHYAGWSVASDDRGSTLTVTVQDLSGSTVSFDGGLLTTSLVVNPHHRHWQCAGAKSSVPISVTTPDGD